MPSAVAAGASSRRNLGVNVEEERAIMQYGTIEQRRRFLRMRLLPLPEDIEAVAVPGTAIMDLPNCSATTATGQLSQTLRFDPLEHIAARYGVGSADEADEEAGEVDDFTDFIEVLCPDGSSLLELLPLIQSSIRESSQKQNVQAPISSPRRSNETCEPSRKELHASTDQPHLLATPQTIHVNVAGRILLTDRLVQSQAHTALPTVIKAYQQYLEATAATATEASAFAKSSCDHGHHHHRRFHPSSSPPSLSSKEQFEVARQRLAPRQRGIVLQCSNTDPEVMKCVAQAVSCRRPSFRQIAPADRYGSSFYIPMTPFKTRR